MANAKGVEIEGKAWCPVFNHEVDDELVHEIAPECVKISNGCGNCPCSEYRVAARSV